jgi:hypothetical protein
MPPLVDTSYITFDQVHCFSGMGPTIHRPNFAAFPMVLRGSDTGSEILDQLDSDKKLLKASLNNLTKFDEQGNGFTGENGLSTMWNPF